MGSNRTSAKPFPSRAKRQQQYSPSLRRRHMHLFSDAGKARDTGMNRYIQGESCSFSSLTKTIVSNLIMLSTHTLTKAVVPKWLSNSRIIPIRSFSQSSRLSATRSFTLNTGAKIPALGFGTFQDKESQEETVCKALKQGMRLIDTARVYDVEQEIGRGMKKSGVAREDIFVATKIWCNDYHPHDVERALDGSLKDLDTPYVNLLMMHYPCTFARGPERFPRDADGRMIRGSTSFIDTWRTMEKVQKSGKAKAIGVSNFSKGEIQTLLNTCDVMSQTGVFAVDQKR